MFSINALLRSDVVFVNVSLVYLDLTFLFHYYQSPTIISSSSRCTINLRRSYLHRNILFLTCKTERPFYNGCCKSTGGNKNLTSVQAWIRLNDCGSLRLPVVSDKRHINVFKIVSLTHRSPLSSRKDPWYSFLLQSGVGMIKSSKNLKQPVVKRTRSLPVCSADSTSCAPQCVI
jgi:hypothetical protein